MILLAIVTKKVLYKAIKFHILKNVDDKIKKNANNKKRNFPKINPV